MGFQELHEFEAELVTRRHSIEHELKYKVISYASIGLTTDICINTRFSEFGFT
jgi:hypothetical protein